MLSGLVNRGTTSRQSLRQRLLGDRAVKQSEVRRFDKLPGSTAEQVVDQAAQDASYISRTASILGTIGMGLTAVGVTALATAFAVPAAAGAAVAFAIGACSGGAVASAGAVIEGVRGNRADRFAEKLAVLNDPSKGQLPAPDPATRILSREELDKLPPPDPSTRWGPPPVISLSSEKSPATPTVLTAFQ